MSQSAHHVDRAVDASAAFPGARAVVRALRLLQLFERRGAAPSMSLAAIRAEAGLTRSTTLRLLGALEAEGMLARDPATGDYVLGARIARLGRLASPSGELRDVARPEIEALHASLGETVTVETLVGADVLIVAESEGGPHVLGARSHLGSTWPAHATSTGKVLLAALEDDAVEARLRGPLRRATASTITRKDAFRRELARARKRGFALALDELELGYAAVAVPVVDAAGTAVAALSVGGPSQRLPRVRLEALVPRLKRAASRIGRALHP